MNAEQEAREKVTEWLAEAQRLRWEFRSIRVSEVASLLEQLQRRDDELARLRKGFTFGQFAETNVQRAKRWHDGDITMWSVSDWLMAMAGEAGEACNAGKKLRRIEEQIANLSADPDRQLSDKESALAKIVEELADTVIYCDLVAQRIGRSLEEAIRQKFNQVSERYSFPERL